DYYCLIWHNNVWIF
nr:immunoglobulin light chain junction region [Macaca mulatta]MOX70558.1 immunoglobulin light chain junction region [Macaca mulatta]MOX72904.1 immunoglobulin light chain junction region [Macaca mulatta]MOX74061.1 immunoglobulin light chain junction region [Macaca mulatta]MOX74879.1 immunoglobulin light chain junction region [Macaca mulatta]